MAFRYTQTTKINAFTYSHADKPYICEFPTVKDDQFFLFRRGLRVVPASKTALDLSIDRDVTTDAEIMELHVKSYDYSDVKNIIEDIRQGCRDFAPDADYSALFVEETPFEIDTNLNTSKFRFITTLHGGK